MANRLWTYHDTTQTLGHGSATTVLNFRSGLESQSGMNPSDVTIQRIIGQINVSAPAGATAYDSAKIFLGIVPVSADAITAGALPEPFGENVPWTWTHGGQVFVPDNPAASLSTLLIPDHVASPPIDSTAQRRIRGRQMSLVMVGYDDSGITGTLNISVTARCLWLVHS